MVTREINLRNLLRCVYGTLIHHKTPVLETFHLSFRAIVVVWTLSHGLELPSNVLCEIIRYVFTPILSLVRLPSGFFRCETLEILELERVILLEFSSRFSFRSLKKLGLISVKYADEESFARLVSNCPVLEDLVVETCHEENVATFTVNVPSLQSLSIKNALRDWAPADDVFVLHYHSLKQLTIGPYFGGLNLIGNMPKLVEANLLSLYCHAKVLQTFPCVKLLSSVYLERVGILVVSFYLSLCVWSYITVKLTGRICLHCHKLQVLKLAKNHQLVVDRAVLCWIEPSCVPECLLFHLKSFAWRDYEGTKEDKKVAFYILKNAR